MHVSGGSGGGGVPTTATLLPGPLFYQRSADSCSAENGLRREAGMQRP